MKDNSIEMQSRKHASEKTFERRHTDRHDERTHRSSHNVDRARSHRVEEKRNERESRALEKKSKKELGRDVKEHRSMKRDQNRRISPLVARREGIHRNSPVELVVKGCRNTDSSSSSDSETEHRNHKSNHNNRQHNKRKHKEESYEELSRRKRRIESELCALQEEEEAENNRSRQEKKKITRNKTSGERKVSTRDELHIKQERISDDERYTRSGRKGSPKRSDNKMNSNEKKPVKNKEKPNFGLSGKLAEDTNTFNGVVIKYNEPKEARKPKRRWRLYPFKGGNPLDFIPIHRQSAYLFGRSRLIADIPIDHPSCSKQHAVLQYRLTDFEREDGTLCKRLRPYIIDLESSNGTFVNNNKIEPRRYVELIERDVIKFGFSSREYVMLHDESKDNSLDDNIVEDT